MFPVFSTLFHPLRAIFTAPLDPAYFLMSFRQSMRGSLFGQEALPLRLEPPPNGVVFTELGSGRVGRRGRQFSLPRAFVKPNQVRFDFRRKPRFYT
jgi:hypothetical protein